MTPSTWISATSSSRYLPRLSGSASALRASATCRCVSSSCGSCAKRRSRLATPWSKSPRIAVAGASQIVEGTRRPEPETSSSCTSGTSQFHSERPVTLVSGAPCPGASSTT
ncbi:hypothetical protein ACFPRL_19485 [Pseudoclavibacter helvolus]